MIRIALALLPALWPALLGTALLAAPAAADDRADLEERLKAAGVQPEDLRGPHPIEADRFHPDEGDGHRPALGGRVIMHIPSQPANICYPIENSSYTRWMLYELHAALVEQDWETWKIEPVLAESYEVEDTLILKGGRGDDNSNILFGMVTEDGDDYVVVSGSPSNPLEETRVPKSEVESLEHSTVFTFHLRPDIRWHDGHLFDSDDVWFSWDLYKNPTVDCDQIRFRFQEVVDADRIDDRSIRFFYRKQYFMALETFTSDFCILPRHLYDLRDPDHADHDPNASMEERGRVINENPHNIDWVGLGPYRMTRWERDDFIEAERFDDYFETDPARRGYVDTLRWKIISDDNAAFQALINEEVDVFARIKTEDYFGELTQAETFTDRLYKAYTYTATYQYTAWNTHLPKLSDPAVRKALAHAFDTQAWVDSKYYGLAMAITGHAFFMTPYYDHALTPPEYDPELAEEMLAEAGWYDRDGNGIVDKDGEDMVLKILIPSGNKASESTVQKIQEGFGQAGVKVEIEQAEWASFLERMYERDFEGINMATAFSSLEDDPFQAWHSSLGAKDVRSTNKSGIRDAELDAAIEAIRREPDPSKRTPHWHKLHARLYELQPYLFINSPPRKFAFNKGIRGVKMYLIPPGYKPRDLYYAEGTPGTRPITD